MGKKGDEIHRRVSLHILFNTVVPDNRDQVAAAGKFLFTKSVWSSLLYCNYGSGFLEVAADGQVDFCDKILPVWKPGSEAWQHLKSFSFYQIILTLSIFHANKVRNFWICCWCLRFPFRMGTRFWSFTCTNLSAYLSHWIVSQEEVHLSSKLNSLSALQKILYSTSFWWLRRREEGKEPGVRKEIINAVLNIQVNMFIKSWFVQPLLQILMIKFYRYWNMAEITQRSHK